MAAAATVSVIVLLVMILVIAGFITGLVLWLTAGKPRRDGEMACGSCGYSVRGLEQFNCPECGADLRVVGIHGGGSAGKRTTGIVLTSVCGLLLLSCFGLTAFSYLFAASSTVTNTSTTVTQPVPNATTSQSQPSGINEIEGDAPGEDDAEGDGENGPIE